jgi:hypothetical protein
MRDWAVTVQRNGRTGTVTYLEGSNRVRCFAEVGGGNVLLIVSGPRPQDWDKTLPWARGRQREIMERVGNELRRLEAPRTELEFGDGDTTVLLRQVSVADQSEIPKP